MLRIFRGALLALVLAGCGTGGMADEEAAGDGQGLFQEKCGSCHELAAAGTRGTIGPSLDAAFAAPREEGFDESSIREVVLGQMRFPIAPMPEPDSPHMFPSSEWTDAEREDAMSAIATYVASVAANEEAIAQARAQSGAQGARTRARSSGRTARAVTRSRPPAPPGRSARTSTTRPSTPRRSRSRFVRAAAGCRPSRASSPTSRSPRWRSSSPSAATRASGLSSRSASRSTTTCVIGTAKRSRAPRRRPSRASSSGPPGASR